MNSLTRVIDHDTTLIDHYAAFLDSITRDAYSTIKQSQIGELQIFTKQTDEDGQQPLNTIKKLCNCIIRISLIFHRGQYI